VGERNCASSNFGLAIRAPQPRDLLSKPNTTASGHEYRDLSEESVRRTGQMCNWHWRERLKKRSSHDARNLLTSMGPQTGDAEAERLYLLSETQRSTSDEEAVQRTLDDLRKFGPQARGWSRRCYRLETCIC